MNIVVDNLLINYREEGEGPVVLMLHGWGSSLQVYDNLARSLSGKYRVVRVDLPGFGGSQKPPMSWGVSEFADLIASLVKKLDLAPYALFGHSFGGQIAVNVVGRGLVLPQRLVLLAASAVRPKPGTRERVYYNLAKIGRVTIGRTPLGAKARAKLYASAGTTDYLQSGEMQEIYRRIIGQDQTSQASQIHSLTLLIWGDQDTDAPLSRGQILHSFIPESRLEVLPGAGHYVFLDCPERVNQLVEEFL